MDYNKEEADRAREAAMKKFLAKDFAGARKSAMKAQSLNPEIDRIRQMVATFAMHLAMQHTINGVIDYYGVLGVKPEADDETVKKRYKKLAAMLHPDRNNSMGRKEAFELVSEAWGALSDKAKRDDYDKKRNKEASPSKSGVKRASEASASSSTTIDGSFWTACSTCKTQFQYHRVHLNQNLKCRHCRNAFIAVETDPPHPGSIIKTFIAATPLTNPPKRRNVMENAVAGSSSAPESNSLREFSQKEATNVLVMTKSKPTIVTSLQDLMETKDVNMVSAGSSQNTSGVESSCYVDSVEHTHVSGTDKDLTTMVPDSGFCDFDKNRTEKSFSDNQIWACYDLSEGMPRLYFMVDKVLSLEPFKLCITQLDTTETNSELRSSTCGGFRAGESQICHSLYLFSHKVDVMNGNNGEFLIYPRTGDVWALYKNWSHDLAGGKEVEYDVVKVVQGYTEEYGVTVVPLIKVDGFKSVFRHYNVDQTKRFSKDELSRFSHQIPSYLLTGKEGVDKLRSCIELDSAATPAQLLHVIDG